MSNVEVQIATARAEMAAFGIEPATVGEYVTGVVSMLGTMMALHAHGKGAETRVQLARIAGLTLDLLESGVVNEAGGQR